MKKSLALLSLFALSSCYYLQQGVRLAGFYGKAVPVQAILSDADLPQDERELLLLVGAVKEFAVSRLGLADDGNYTSYIRTDNTSIAEVVSACKSDSFDQYQFDFLLAGKLPYKGFFKTEEAQKEAEMLVSKGYDVMVRGVEAFSTVGILSDPIMSYMKTRSPFSLAEVIIHEQVHATVFTTEYPEASENLATFVGETGALEYVRSSFGETSEEYGKSVAALSDSKTYNRLILELHSTLDGIYKNETGRDEKLKQKEEAIGRWKTYIETQYDNLFETRAYKSVRDAKINNAYIVTHLNYTRNLDLYERLFRKTGNSIKRMMAMMERIIREQAGNPEAILLEYLSDDNLTL